MIHQFIFVGPTPDLSAEALQGYWVNFHAVNYAAKIPQILRYLVATRRSGMHIRSALRYSARCRYSHGSLHAYDGKLPLDIALEEFGRTPPYC